MAEKRDWLTWAESRLALLLQLKALPLIGGIMSGVVAWLTDFMDAWSPFSWFAAAVAGAVAFQLFGLLRQMTAEWEEKKRRIQMLQAPKGQLNPLDREFRNLRVYIHDLLPPGEKIIARKDLRDCEVVGPAVVCFLGTAPGRGRVFECGFVDTDLVLVDVGVRTRTAIVFRDCEFRNCTFYDVTILVPTPERRAFEEGFPHIEWLNADSVREA